jgi:hypothetical protein
MMSWIIAHNLGIVLMIAPLAILAWIINSVFEKIMR